MLNATSTYLNKESILKKLSG